MLTHVTGHRGSTIDLSEIDPIKNVPWNKPVGGLWLSINEGWERWCSSEMPEWLRGERFEVKINSNSNILVIEEEKDLQGLPINPLMADKHCPDFKGYGNFYIDFEILAEKYDAMAVMIQSGDVKLYSYLYGWDCDSMVVFNKDIVESISKITPYEY